MKEYTCPCCNEQTDKLVDVNNPEFDRVCEWCCENRPVHQCKKCGDLWYSDDMIGDTCIDCIELSKYYNYLDNFVEIEQERIYNLQILIDAVERFEILIDATNESIKQRSGYFPELDADSNHRINRWTILRNAAMNDYLELLNTKY